MSDSPYYRFYRRITYPVPIKLWLKLPRLSTHKNEYWDGKARLSPRPNICQVTLPLVGWTAPLIPEGKGRPCVLEVSIRQLADDDWEKLPELYHSAFARQQPLSSWNSFAAARASRAIIRHTQLGRDGPLVPNACFVASARSLFRKEEPFKLCGGAIVTLVPLHQTVGVPVEDSVAHPEKPETLAVPHLNWIFVSFECQKSGVATLLLEDVVNALRTKGFKTLSSTILLDNTSSMQWHWRSGFKLPPRPYESSLPQRIDETYLRHSKQQPPIYFKS